MKKLILLLIIILILPGCYNYKELNEIAISSAMGIDKINDEYIITIQIINTEKNNENSNAGQTKFTNYEGRGKNIQEAIRNLTNNVPKHIYPNSMQILIINEEIAKEGIYDILDFFFRKTESNKQVYPLISKNTKANDILNTITPIVTLNSNKIKDSLILNSTYYGVSKPITLEELLKIYLNPNKEFTLPSIYIKNNNKDYDNLENLEKTNTDTTIILGPTAIFKSDKLIGYLTEEESINLNIYNNSVENAILTTNCDENNYSIELTNIKTKTSINNNTANININADGRLVEITCNYDLENNKIIDEMNKKSEENLNNKITETINKIINEYNSDVLGFMDKLYKYNYKFYNKINNKYEYFKNLKINVNSKININSKGNLTKVIKNEKD